MKKLMIYYIISIGLLFISVDANAQRDFYIKKNDGSIIKPNDEYRIALVIGNNNYKNTTKLKNPINDASDMKSSLKQLGFNVLSLYDGSRKQIIEQIKLLREKSKGSNVVILLFYAGHGIQANDDNWIVPIDANPKSEADVEIECISLNYVVKNFETVNSGTNIIIMDACRENPFSYSGRSSKGGLNMPKITPKGTFIAFSTSPGMVAYDGEGRNSPYTRELKRAVLVPNIPIEKTFKNVRFSLKEQTSWENSSLIGDFYFNPTGGGKNDNVIIKPKANYNEICTTKDVLIEFPNIKGSNSSTSSIYAKIECPDFIKGKKFIDIVFEIKTQAELDKLSFIYVDSSERIAERRLSNNYMRYYKPRLGVNKIKVEQIMSEGIHEYSIGFLVKKDKNSVYPTIYGCHFTKENK